MCRWADYGGKTIRPVNWWHQWQSVNYGVISYSDTRESVVNVKEKPDFKRLNKYTFNLFTTVEKHCNRVRAVLIRKGIFTFTFYYVIQMNYQEGDGFVCHLAGRWSSGRGTIHPNQILDPGILPHSTCYSKKNPTSLHPFPSGVSVNKIQREKRTWQRCARSEWLLLIVNQ